MICQIGTCTHGLFKLVNKCDIMEYKLFIDDERFPFSDDWVIARSSEEAIQIMADRGLPTHIAFDHDLGGHDTSGRVVNWIIEALLDGHEIVTDTFSFSVHSQNPIGAAMIRAKMNAILQHVKETSNGSGKV